MRAFGDVLKRLSLNNIVKFVNVEWAAASLDYDVEDVMVQ